MANTNTKQRRAKNAVKRNKNVTCVACGEIVSRRNSRQDEPGKRRCKTHYAPESLRDDHLEAQSIRGKTEVDYKSKGRYTLRHIDDHKYAL